MNCQFLLSCFRFIQEANILRREFPDENRDCELEPILQRRKELEEKVNRRKQAAKNVQKVQVNRGKYTKAVSGNEAVPFLTKSQSQPKLDGKVSGSGFAKPVQPTSTQAGAVAKPKGERVVS